MLDRRLRRWSRGSIVPTSLRVLRKFLAVVCIGPCLLLAWAVVHGAMVAFSRTSDGNAAYQGGYVAGVLLGALLSGVLLFFLARWIWRVLRK